MYKKNDNEEDYNAKIYKLHESLQKKNTDILKTNDFQLVNVYTELLGLVYEILINNHVRLGYLKYSQSRSLTGQFRSLTSLLI